MSSGGKKEKNLLVYLFSSPLPQPSTFAREEGEQKGKKGNFFEGYLSEVMAREMAKKK